MLPPPDLEMQPSRPIPTNVDAQTGTPGDGAAAACPRDGDATVRHRQGRRRRPRAAGAPQQRCPEDQICNLDFQTMISSTGRMLGPGFFFIPGGGGPAPENRVIVGDFTKKIHKKHHKNGFWMETHPWASGRGLHPGMAQTHPFTTPFPGESSELKRSWLKWIHPAK